MKRRWWIWTLLALASFVVVFGVSELAGISIGSILGWGTLGVLGVFLYSVLLVFLALFAFLIAYTFKLLLKRFISNEANRYFTLGILGFCIVLAGYFLTIAEFKGSILIVAAGFFMGFLSGLEYQRTQGELENLRKELYQMRREKTDSIMKAMSTESLLAIKEEHSGDVGITSLVDEILDEKEKTP